jgi:hypothetical protein
MKKIGFIFMALGVILLFSCMQTNTQNDYAPQISYAGSVTLNGTAISSLDTLTVGDTLLLPLTLQGFYNPITSFSVSNDTTVSKISFPGIAALGSTILANDSTKLNNGYIYFGTSPVSTVMLTVQYVPTKPSNTATLTLIVSSTSQSSPQGVTLSLPAKAKTVTP